MARVHLGDGGEVDRGVFADRGVRATAGLDADDPIRRQDLHPHQRLGVLLGVDIVGDHADGMGCAEPFGEGGRERRLAGADGAANPDTQGAVGAFHVRNILVGRVSWCIAAMSVRKAVAESRSRSPLAVSAATAGMRAVRRRKIACPSVCPTGSRRCPAATRFDRNAWRYMSWVSSNGRLARDAAAPEGDRVDDPGRIAAPDRCRHRGEGAALLVGLAAAAPWNRRRRGRRHRPRRPRLPPRRARRRRSAARRCARPRNRALRRARLPAPRRPAPNRSRPRPPARGCRQRPRPGRPARAIGRG